MEFVALLHNCLILSKRKMLTLVRYMKNGQITRSNHIISHIKNPAQKSRILGLIKLEVRFLYGFIFILSIMRPIRAL